MGKPFFPGLVKYMASGPVVAMVWEGLNAVKTGRVLLGETNPADSKPGTIRGDFCIQVGRNICHGSDAVESAQKEIACGSRRTNWSTGTPVRRPGYTSRVTAVYVFLHQNEDYKNKNYLMKINRFTFGK